MDNIIDVAGVEIGENRPCFFIAEIGLNHNGSMLLARELVEAAARSGAAMVKFQKRCIDALAVASFLDAPFPKCPSFGKTQREVRNRLEFSREQMEELAGYARQWGLLFSMSVFDAPSLDVAVAMRLPVVKIAGHSVTNGPLLEAVAATRLPVIMSLGATSWDERDQAVAILGKNPLCLLHCISSYPCPETCVKLDTIPALKTRYGRPVGYSGHEAGTDVSIAASVLGASVIERHFTLSRSMVGLDHGVSLEPGEFADLVQRVRRLEKARGAVEGIAPDELPSRRNYHVAVCARRPIRKGEVIRAEDLVCKQPLGESGVNFTGLEIAQVLGKRATTDLAPDAAIPRRAVS